MVLRQFQAPVLFAISAAWSSFSLAAAPTLCGKAVALDGVIGEFVHAHGNSQEYFITSPGHPSRGALREDAEWCGELNQTIDDHALSNSEFSGQTGFEDGPGITPLGFSPTGFNIGRVWSMCSMDQDPDGRRSNGYGVCILGIDVSAPGSMDFDFGTHPVAFDVDGDGSRETQTEIWPNSVSEAPYRTSDSYSVSFDVDQDGEAELRMLIGESRFPPGEVLLINPLPGIQSITGQDVYRFLEFSASFGPPGDSSLRGASSAAQFLDVNDDGIVDCLDFGIDQDLELVLVNISELGIAVGDVVQSRITAYAADDGHWSDGADSISFRIPVRGAAGCSDVCPTDGNACTHQRCVGGVCESRSAPYGDADGSGSIPDGNDVLCVIDAIFDPLACFAADLYPCETNGTVDVDDLIAVILAASGETVCECDDPAEFSAVGALTPALMVPR